MQSTFVRKLAAGVTIAGLLLSAVPTFASSSGPTVTLTTTSSSPTGNTIIPITATIGTSTTHFTQSNISVTNATISGFSGSGTTYSFNLSPTVAPGDPDGNHYVMTVSVADNAFDGNQPSNTLTIGYDPRLASSSTGTTTSSGTGTTTSSGGTGTTTSSGGSTGTQTITITGPNGATSDNTNVALSGSATTSPVVFTFTSSNASSTLWCSIAGQTSADSFFMCGSPQTYMLPMGDYRFSVQAHNSTGTTSASRLFSIGTTTSTGTTTQSGGTGTTTNTGGNSSGGSSSGGGGGTTSSTPAPVHEGGNGSAVGGPETGHAVIPGEGLVATTNGSAPGEHAVIPTVPVATTGSGASAPVVSQSSGGSALIGSNSPSSSRTTTRSTTGASTGTTVTPGTPNTGSDVTSTDTMGASTTPDQTLLPATNSLTAAAANSGGGIPGWVWLVLAAIVLIAIGIWAVRQPA